MKMVQESSDDKIGKVVVLGRKGVGKTALVVRCLTRRFLPEYAPCKETSYRYKRAIKDGKDSEMIIIDSDGQNNDTIRCTEAFIFVYSVTSKQSLDTLESMIRNVQNLCKNEPHIIVVANQIDLVQKREVTTIQGKLLANRVGADFYEVSVANDVEQIIDIFHRVHQKINGTGESKKRKTQNKLIDMFKRRGSS